ncbi:3-dehydroquinate synthase [Anaeromicropila populeti]|uniref:3-dehydroquinate synthase n=1 Tax=Anaeromicropila populeti TaxID=37658 RepID=A0A1I6L927_9FIRM|nr:3-dehydroquinate synthase [Anaeromicropila populeti]SFR99738.1 3-dehydroquinate synthase [Anaeromicropila populeti]
MNNRITVKENNLPIYEIWIEDSYEQLVSIFEPFHMKEYKICIVTDSNVEKFYLQEVKKLLQGVAGKVVHYTMPAGEESKNLNTVQRLYEFLIKEHFDRKDMLIALGGGVVGDLTGYTAATFLRGIRFVQMPTSLLAMVDSSVGGKTGVDFLEYKNMIGAFHQPKAVYINLSVLNTLTKEHYFNGLGEVVKYGMIQSLEFYHWLINHVETLQQKEPSALREIVYKSCTFKQEIVEEDPHELNIRAYLNFGHTLGHAIEKWSKFSILHGECVALGMIAATYLSVKRGFIEEKELDILKDLLDQLQLPIQLNEISKDEVVLATKNDKKMDAGTIQFVLLKQIGEAVLDRSVTEQDMIEALEYLMR